MAPSEKKNLEFIVVNISAPCRSSSQLLVLEISATPLHICLPPASPGSHLLTACEDGLYCFNTQLGARSSTKR